LLQSPLPDPSRERNKPVQHPVDQCRCILDEDEVLVPQSENHLPQSLGIVEVPH
jgi:hypothetical protein